MDCVTFVSDCHVRIGAELLSHKWDAVVLTALRPGPRHRAELLEQVGGIRDKVLHQALGRLTQHRLVEQVGGAGSAYQLSELGRSLVIGPLRELAEWSSAHAEELAVG